MKFAALIGVSMAVFALVGCNGVNPLNPSSGGSNSSNPPDADLDLLPGTTNPSRTRSIERYEARDGEGSGYAQGISYNAGSDTFTVDNLAFDGDTPYVRDTGAPALDTTGTVRVYENVAIVTDPVSGNPINQFPHKAVMGRSTNLDSNGNPKTTFAIVRTGAYIDYGFGGFIYDRSGGVTIPTSSQATFSGDYAGLRDFKGTGGLEFVSGQMTLDIDFDDFNDGNGVKARVDNRRYYDLSGTDVTPAYLAAMSLAELPVLTFVVGPGVMDSSGELAGEAISNYIDASGVATQYEQGNYYAMMSGDGAEVVGVIVVEGDHPLISGVNFRETGGFIVYR